MSIPTSFPAGFTTARFAAQKRYFALKLPVAGGDKTVTFAYVDPGHATAVELNSWGAAHGPLWDAIRAKERRVEVIAIGAELDAVLRADRLLQLWAAAEPGKVATGLTVKQEISAIREALHSDDDGIYEPVRRDARSGGAVQRTHDTSRSGACERGLD